MQITERILNDVAILVIDGQLVSDQGASRLTDAIIDLRHRSFSRVIIDLSRSAYMDSAGLGSLIQAYATISKAGGTLRLMGVTARLRNLLAITKLVTIFETFDDEGAAVASFSAEPAGAPVPVIATRRG